MPDTITIQDVQAGIMRGDFDGDFDTITAAIRHRNSALNIVQRSAFKLNDRVSFVGGQKYLHGIEGTVVGFTNTKILIDVDENPRARQYSGAKGVRAPASMLRKVEVPATA